jgi:hypothetical protein
MNEVGSPLGLLVSLTNAFSAWDYTGTDGLTSGGAASLAKVKAYLASGGMTVAGAATTSYVAGTSLWQYTGSGGFVSGGAANLLKIKVFLSTGGLTSSGVATLAKIKVFLTSGGLLVGGVADVSKLKVFLASGGALFSGSAAIEAVKTFLASGGMLLSGTAIAEFFPQPNTFFCAGSGGFDLGGYAETGKCTIYSYLGTGGFGEGTGISRPKSMSMRGTLFK